jgi:rhomboid protease GluP
VGWLIVIIVLTALTLKASTREERLRLLAALRELLLRLRAAAAHNLEECKPFHDALRARMRWPIVTPVLVALHVLVFLGMLFGSGAISDPDTLVSWGATYGPRTTNGEWWRLVTSMFVQPSLLALLVNLAGLTQLGLILERIVGRQTLAAVYVVTGIFASLVSIAASPIAVAAGASGAIFGLYGLLIACCVWDLFRPWAIPVPLVAVKRLVPAALIFFLYNANTDHVGTAAEFIAFVIGFGSGLVLTNGAGERQPAPKLLGIVSGSALVVAIVAAVPLRGIADVRPEITRVIAIEDQTAPVYRNAESRYRKNQINASMLADLIEMKIMPELQKASERLQAITGVPKEQAAMMDDAQEYVRLRYESWRLRVEGLRRTAAPVMRRADGAGLAAEAKWRDSVQSQYRTNQIMLGRAEGTERESLEVLERLRPSNHN